MSYAAVFFSLPPTIIDKQKDRVVQSVYIANLDPFISYETKENYIWWTTLVAEKQYLDVTYCPRFSNKDA